MDSRKRKRLEKAGWQFGDAEAFITGLKPNSIAFNQLVDKVFKDFVACAKVDGLNEQLCYLADMSRSNLETDLMVNGDAINDVITSKVKERIVRYLTAPMKRAKRNG